MAADNKTLGRFELSGIPAAPRGVPKIEVAFDIDANGIVNVSAKDLGTGKEQKITITSSGTLDKDEVDRMVKEAEANAEADKKRKEGVEVKNQADNLIYQAEKTMKDMEGKGKDDLIAKVKTAVDTLKESVKGDDLAKIKADTEALTKPLYELSAELYKETEAQKGAEGATGNHFHFSGGKGLFKGNGWVQNSKGKWVLYVTTKAEKPENLFFIDKSFTKIVNSKGLWFEPLPTEKNKKTYAAGNYKVTKANLLYIREKPSTKAKKKQFNELSESARKKILSIGGKKANGYVKGLTFSVLKVQDNWGQTPSGWVCLDYCERKHSNYNRVIHLSTSQ